MTILVDGFETVEDIEDNWASYLSYSVLHQNFFVTQGEFGSGAKRNISGTTSAAMSMYKTGGITAGTYYLDVYARLYSGSSNYRFMVWNRVTSTIYAVSSMLSSSTSIIDFSFDLPANLPANQLEFRLFNDSLDPDREIELFVDNFRREGEDIFIPVDNPFSFELDYPKSGAIPGDWYPPDWNTSDWFTESSGTFLIRAFVDTVIPVTTPKHFNLNFKTPIFFVDQVLNSATKHFKLNKKTPILAVDQVLSIDDTEHFDLNITSGAVFLAGGIFIPQTKHFFLRPKQVAFNFELIRDYPVSLSLPFNYEILGVSVNSVEGEGRFAIVSNGNVLVQDLPFSPEVTNHVLSGIMVNKGDDLRVVVYMQNGYFRSFKTDFALKRI